MGLSHDNITRPQSSFIGQTSSVETFLVMITPKGQSIKIALVLKQGTEASKHADQNNGYRSRGKNTAVAPYTQER